MEARSSREEDVNPDLTGRPVVCSERASQTRFSRDCKNFNVEDEFTIERRDPLFALNQIVQWLNEVDIDFRVPGLPHSVVKHAENYHVRRATTLIVEL